MTTSLPLPLTAPIEPGLMVIHGNRLEDLRDLLTSWLARAPLRPLESELMLVQSNGIAQWLKLALARPTAEGGLGISAAVDVELPGRFLWLAYRAVLGRDAVPPTSPFDKSRLTWRLLRLIPQHLHDERFRPLRDFLANDQDWRKQFQLAARIADLFDQYQVYRAHWLDAWERGEDALPDDWRGRVTPLPDDQRWQAHLWRLLLTDVGTQERETHRAAVHRRFLHAASALSERPAGLPRRIAVFGISSLPQQTLEALTALARHCQILLVVANPCRHYWADIIEDRELLRAEQRRQSGKVGLPETPRYEDLHLHANPLLAAWGKQGRDYIRLLDSFDQPDRYRQRFTSWGRGIDVFIDGNRDALLGQIQQAILDLEPLPANRDERQPWQVGDESVSFHIAHNPQREVEILHDRLLAMFERARQEDRPLAARDVIVMVPDIQTYAPHIQAVFGRIPRNDPRYLPHSVADQAERGTAPLVVALEHLLSLPESRFTVGDILDLLDVPSLRKCFGFHEASLPTLRRWIEGAGIRWGLDAAQKEHLGLPPEPQNSWRFGLGRMLLGYAVGPGDTWDDIAPFGEVGGLDAALIGPLWQLVQALESTWQALAEPATPAQWVQRLRQLLRDFFDSTDSTDSDRLVRLEDALENWLDACREASLDEPLPLAIVREFWLEGLDAARLSQRFMGGAISFGTLMPMRAIPFRVVCLLGMNDGDYPRRQMPADFDLMALPGQSCPGDRSRREDDRYLFLEALLSVRDTLHVSWVGRSARDNSVLPPSVLVGQLRDYLDAGWHPAGQPETSVVDAITTEYPLQPFSRRYFSEGEGQVFTYAGEWQRAHHAPVDAASQSSTAWVPESSLGLSALQSFMARPVRQFFQQRLKVFFNDEHDEAIDDEPFALDRLQRFQAVSEVVKAGLADQAGVRGPAFERAVRQLVLQGQLPPGGFGELWADDIAAEAKGLLQAWQAAQFGLAPVTDKLELRFEAHGLVIEEWLAGWMRDDLGQWTRLELLQGELSSKDGPRLDRLISPWVTHVFAHACGVSLRTIVVTAEEQAVFAPLDPRQAAAWLEQLMAALLAGMHTPLPMARKAAFAWLNAERSGKDPASLARATYDEEPGERRMSEVTSDPYLRRAWPNFATMHAAGFTDWLHLYRPLVDAWHAGRTA